MFSRDSTAEICPSPLVTRSVPGGVPTNHCVKLEVEAEQERVTFPPVRTAWLRGSSTVNCEPGLENIQ